MKLKNAVLAVLVLAGLAIMCSTVGCGRTGSGATVELADLGFSMRLPASWQADEANSGRAVFSAPSIEDSIGSVFRFPLEGKVLSEYVQASSPRTEEKTPTTISGLEAIEVLEKGLARTCLTAYIRKQNDVLVVTFGTLPADFPSHERSLRQALRSITIR